MNCPAADTEVASTVSGLSDDQLLEQTSKLAGLDHQVHVFVIDHLLEIEARRLYLTRGFSSLFDYVKLPHRPGRTGVGMGETRTRA